MKAVLLVLVCFAEYSHQIPRNPRETLFGFAIDGPSYNRPKPMRFQVDQGQKNYFFPQSETSNVIDFTDYATAEKIDEYLTYLGNKYSDLVKIRTIGHSVEGRPIKVVQVTSERKDKPKPSIIVDAGIHAREWISPMVALYLLNQLVEHNSKHSDLTEDVNWHIIPLLNPDGYVFSMKSDRFWRKNRANTTNSRCVGVDLNRNFDLYFGGEGTSTDPCSETFTGPRPFSEPETRALRDYSLTIDNLKMYLTLHSYGKFFLYPWGFAEVLPRDWKDLDMLARRAKSALQKVQGTSYKVGSSTQILGAAAGGSDDWMKARAGVKYTYTIELPGGGSQGFDLPPDRIPMVTAETFEALKVLGMFVGNNYR